MAEDETRTVHMSLTGRVQGVWFRGFVEENARALGVAGWVRNRRDGSVEAVFQGRAGDVEGLVARCREGPPAARVTGVEVAEIEPVPVNGFEVRAIE